MMIMMRNTDTYIFLGPLVVLGFVSSAAVKSRRSMFGEKNSVGLCSFGETATLKYLQYLNENKYKMNT